MKKILCLGQCSFDSSLIKSKLEKPCDAQITFVDTATDAERQMEKQSFDLVLVNRLFDRDGGSGVAWITQQSKDNDDVALMLVSNYADAQKSAIAGGAVQGFGKADLGDKKVVDAINNALAKRSS